MSIGNKCAFPSDKEFEHDPDCEGMTYRQWLVGMALQGILANPVIVEAISNGVPDTSMCEGWIVKSAISHANATIKELDSL